MKVATTTPHQGRWLWLKASRPAAAAGAMPSATRSSRRRAPRGPSCQERDCSGPLIGLVIGLAGRVQPLNGHPCADQRHGQDRQDDEIDAGERKSADGRNVVVLGHALMGLLLCE